MLPPILYRRGALVYHCVSSYIIQGRGTDLSLCYLLYYTGEGHWFITALPPILYRGGALVNHCVTSYIIQGRGTGHHFSPSVYNKEVMMPDKRD